MTIEPFNEQADALLSDLLDRAEAKLVRNGICPAEQADEFLTVRYIEAVAGMIYGACVYLPNDERIGADMFLWKLGDARFRSWSNKRKRMCAVQLVGHTHVYFPKYHTVLSLTYRRILQATCGQDRHYLPEAILMLAAATLPGARSEIRRELRRRGSDKPLTLVPFDVLLTKQSAIQSDNHLSLYLANQSND